MSHSVAVRYFPLRNCFGTIVVVRWVDFAGDDVVQQTTEFNLAFEAPLLVGSLVRVLIVLTIVFNAGFDIVKVESENSGGRKFFHYSP